VDELFDQLFALVLRVAAATAVVTAATATAVTATSATTTAAATAAARTTALGTFGTIWGSGLCRNSRLGGSSSFCLGLNLGAGVGGRSLDLRGFVFLHH
jgi:hypothetical protein